MGQRSQVELLIRAALDARSTAQRTHDRAELLRLESERLSSQAAALRKRCQNDWRLPEMNRRN